MRKHAQESWGLFVVIAVFGCSQTHSVDGVSFDEDFASALSCDVDSETALHAAVRASACSGMRYGPNARYMMDLWETGAVSGFEAFYFPELRFGCEDLHCAATADSCEAYQSYRSALVVARSCVPGAMACDGNFVSVCNDDGSGLSHVADCSNVGAECSDGRCVRGDDCRIGDFGTLRCDGDELTICGGEVRIDCGGWRPGTSCQFIRQEGENPTAFGWCAPEAAGISFYRGPPIDGFPLDCSAAGVLEFMSASGRTHRYDCRANGYSGCDGSSCTP